MRFFCESIETESYLDPIESGHLCRVLRARKGTRLRLFDGKGTLAEGIVEQVDKKRTMVRVTNITHTPALRTGRIILAVSFAKGQRFDWLVEKCTELGVDHIAAVQFDRSVKLGKDTALKRYRKISISAAKQSKRLFLPHITGPQKLPQTLDTLIQKYPQSVLVHGDPQGISFSERSVLNEDAHDCLIFIGPEGGFSKEELALLKAYKSSGVLINRNVLRIETAAVAFCAIASLGRL